MKVVVVTNILTPYRIPLFEALQRRVDDFMVFLMAGHEENRQWELGMHHFKMEVLRGVHLRPPGREVSLHLNYGVIRALRKCNPDIVINGGFGPTNVASLIYCKLFRKKFIGWGELTLRDDAESSIVRQGLRRWLTCWSDGSIASSSEAREAFRQYGAMDHRILTSVMPIDVDRFHEQALEFRKTSECRGMKEKYPGPILLSIGRITKRKGYPELFTIYQRIVEARPDVSLLIVGDGHERGAYEEQARERGWANMHFAGFVQANELPKFLAVADLFVFHTLFDPFGAVLSEAMAAELPVVSSVYAAATRDLVKDGVTGFRIDPKDAGSSAATILKVLEMKPEERAVMGKAAYAQVKQFDIEASGDAIIRFIRSLFEVRELGGEEPLHTKAVNRVKEEDG